MMVQDKLLYGPFAGHVELREEILRHSGEVLSRAIHLRNSIGIVTIVLGLLRFMGLVAPVQGLGWFVIHSFAITLSLLAAWVFAVVNVWCCRQRFDDCRTRLMEYVSQLPTSTE